MRLRVFPRVKDMGEISPKFRTFAKLAAALLFAKVLLSIFYEYRYYFPLDFHRSDFLLGRQDSFNGLYPIGFYSHLVAGPIAVVLGAIQMFSGKVPAFRKLQPETRSLVDVGDCCRWPKRNRDGDEGIHGTDRRFRVCHSRHSHDVHGIRSSILRDSRPTRIASKMGDTLFRFALFATTSSNRGRSSFRDRIRIDMVIPTECVDELADSVGDRRGGFQPPPGTGNPYCSPCTVAAGSHHDEMEKTQRADNGRSAGRTILHRDACSSLAPGATSSPRRRTSKQLFEPSASDRARLSKP